MRRFHAFLLAAGVMAAPAGAVANPSDPPHSDSWTAEKLEVSGKGRLGVMVMSLTDDLRSYFGSPDRTGVLVAHVEPGSPAARAGIAVGDVIVEVRGTKIDDGGDVLAALAGAGTDQRATVKVLRNKKPLTLDVHLDRESTSSLDALPGFRWLREMFELPPARSTST